MRTFEEILKDVKNSCSKVFYCDIKNIMSDMIEAATKIYIAELEADSYQKAREDIF